ncbi:squamous cell carcinoma antigen recognized by T-cells 3 isoform X2 [Protopterus annectens]|uniref:squamous cell carcinoma antigen recognized by T-cells 3 isoform X2 n=1 Tax=Protopterus annectens TaxID=7888 RepID=UPI001CF9BAFD|nr:squamous cell carcinoma antigen recognized by T-cells 3 isoform X2 [Protopterus annectens]
MATSDSEEELQHQRMEEEDEKDLDESEVVSEGEAKMEKDEGSEEEEDSSDEDEKENEAEIQRLEEQLSINAYDYNCHVDLIKLLRHEGELIKLRRACQKMSELFPLSEEIWLDWLRDEIRMASEESDREKVYELFEKAVKDYICPEIWLEYAQYSIGGIEKTGGIEKVRAVFERAVTSVGLHMTKGAAIWEAYREFENAVLSLQEQLSPDPSSEEAGLQAQRQRINSLFLRQLSVPLLDMEGTYAEYEEWCGSLVLASVKQLYNKTLQQLEKYRSYEDTLLIAEPPKLSEYQAYIDFEMKEGDPLRIQLIFERAIAENCLVPDLWSRYTQYLDRQLKIKDLVLAVHSRAVRNCPWTVGLWKRYLLALERHDADHQTVSDVFEKALSAGFIQAWDYVEIWQAYLDYLRRRVDFRQDSSKELEELRSAFSRAMEYLKTDVEERFSESGDPSCTIMQNWARIEARHCNNMQRARELWDSIMTKGNAKFANMWLEYCNLERAHGDAQHCRKALHRAVQCTSDYPEHVCEVLLNFERIEGTLEDWDTAVQKTETRLSRINEQRTKAAEKEAAFVQKEDERAEQRKKARADKKALKKAKRDAKFGEKRKAEEREEEEWDTEEVAGQPNKKTRGEGDYFASEKIKNIDAKIGLFGRELATKIVDHPSQQKTVAAAHKNDMGKVLHDHSKDSITVFVSNLSYSMDDPEDKMKETLGKCGEIAEIRPVYSNKGNFRGYCYVEFKDEKSALDALKLDRKEIDGRPMFVSPCIDKARNPEFKVFKYSTALEKHKLFISGLPFSCTKEELEEICRGHGTVKEIRLVTNRSGKPKGLAYVEYENETQASQAVLKMDGMTVKDHCIKVAISNPPRRNVPEKTDPNKPTGPMVPRQIYGARGKGRTQLALLPRALVRQNVVAAKTENGTFPDTVPASSSSSVAQETPKKLTNADFARMLLNK